MLFFILQLPLILENILSSVQIKGAKLAPFISTTLLQQSNLPHPYSHLKIPYPINTRPSGPSKDGKINDIIQKTNNNVPNDTPPCFFPDVPLPEELESLFLFMLS